MILNTRASARDCAIMRPPAQLRMRSAERLDLSGDAAVAQLKLSGPNQFRRGKEETTDRAGSDASSANNASIGSRERQPTPRLRASGLTGGSARGLLVVARRRHHHEANSGQVAVTAESVFCGVVEAPPPGVTAAAGFDRSYARERGRFVCLADSGANPDGSTASRARESIPSTVCAGGNSSPADSHRPRNNTCLLNRARARAGTSAFREAPESTGLSSAGSDAGRLPADAPHRRFTARGMSRIEGSMLSASTRRAQSLHWSRGTTAESSRPNPIASSMPLRHRVGLARLDQRPENAGTETRPEVPVWVPASRRRDRGESSANARGLESALVGTSSLDVSSAAHIARPVALPRPDDREAGIPLPVAMTRVGVVLRCSGFDARAEAAGRSFRREGVRL